VTEATQETTQTTREIPVRFEFGDRSRKMSTAERLHGHSILSDVEALVDSDIPGDPEMARETLDALRRAVNDDEIGQATATGAFQRHLLAENATDAILQRVGPSDRTETNLARTTARYTFEVAIDALLFVAALKASAAAAAGSIAVQVGVGTAVTVVNDAVGYLLSEMMPVGQQIDAKDRAQEVCRDRAESLVARLVDGTITSATALAEEVESVVDDLVETFAGVFRAYVELANYSVVFQATAPSVAALSDESMYGSLIDLDRRLQPERLAESGLDGDTDVATAVVDDTLPDVLDAIDGTVGDIEEFGAIASEFNLYDQAVDMARGGSGVVEAIQNAIATVKNGIVAVVYDATAALTGALSFIVVKKSHTQLMRAIARGEEVPFTHV
jgi:hypothetical protein